MQNATQIGRKTWSIIAALLPLLAALAPAAAQAEETSFAQGTAAYRAGDFRQALAFFQQAWTAGDSSDTLAFNLGLSHYRIGQYVEARGQFERLLSHPEFSAAAEYHLGLIAAQSGDLPQAIERLQTVHERKDSPPEIRAMAELALGRLQAPPAPRLTGNLSLATGYDDNLALQPDSEAVSSGHAEDGLMQALGYLSYPLGAGATPLADLHGSFYLREYAADQTYDQYSTELSLRHSWQGGAWNGWIGLGGAGTWLGGEYFQSNGSLGAEASRRTSRQTLTLRLRLEHVRAAREFTYLDGWRYRAELAQSWTLGRVAVGAAYDLEWNQRRNLELDGEYFDQSPLRQGLSLRLTHTLADALSLEWLARFRHSAYHNPHRIFSEAEFVQEQRIDQFLQYGFTARYRFRPTLSYGLDYRFNDNHSNLRRYDYQRHVALLNLDWRY